MIRTAKEQHLVTREARVWRDQLRRGVVRRLSDTEAITLAHLLDELQHAVAHQLTFPASDGGR